MQPGLNSLATIFPPLPQPGQIVYQTAANFGLSAAFRVKPRADSIPPRKPLVFRAFPFLSA
jgi:hypothetical protein